MRRRPIEEGESKKRNEKIGRDPDGGEHSAVRTGDERQCDERQGNPARRGIAEYRHRRCDLPSGEPVGDHLRHRDIQEDAAAPAIDSAGDQQRPRRRKAHRQFASDHERKAGQRDALVAEARADGTAEKGEDDAGCTTEPDQQPDIGDANREVRHEQRGEPFATTWYCRPIPVRTANRRASEIQRFDDMPELGLTRTPV